MFYIIAPLAAPFVLAAALIDVYILLILARLVTSVMSVGNNTVLPGLKAITDPLPEALHRALSRRCRASCPYWVPWFATITAALFLRQFLITIALSMAGTGSHA